MTTQLKTMSRMAVCIVALLLTVLVSDARVQTGQSSESPLLREYSFQPPTSATLEDRLIDVDAALVVRVVAGPDARVTEYSPETLATLAELQPGMVPAPDVISHYQVEVVEVLKPHPLAGGGGGTLTIGQLGGVAQSRSGRWIEARTSAGMLVPGQRYLLFLKYQERHRLLMIELFDIFRVSDVAVEGGRLTRHTRYAAQLSGRRFSDAVNAIAAAVYANSLRP